MKIVANHYFDGLSETEKGLAAYAGGLSLEGIGSELRALYDDVTASEPPEDLRALAEKVDTLAGRSVTKA